MGGVALTRDLVAWAPLARWSSLRAKREVARGILLHMAALALTLSFGRWAERCRQALDVQPRVLTETCFERAPPHPWPFRTRRVREVYLMHAFLRSATKLLEWSCPARRVLLHEPAPPWLIMRA